ncbi:phosphopantetheine-binding protein [Lyngbya sp. PCC 8106]|uniref:phosphopantetheine-binding protein n=1 Tax=Lyngbya sp. (strain PCC 8106) TaxID=313612 RepID=UPI0000EAB6AE|nr:phosphopantetheine-binding protein [Lyngbya sp. PCC 8106]EAW34489.1 hypothetical protein L8106_03412 [Lyngbya sp. PCC 8106]
MNESENEYQLKILDMAANLCLDKIATPTDENLIFMESNVDKIVWDMATEIYQQSGFKADLARVRDIVISRLEKMRYQIQLEAERKAVEEAKRLSELQEQAEQKAVEEAKRLSELREQAEQKATEEVKREPELRQQAEQKAAEEAKREAELKPEIFLQLRRVLAEQLGFDEEDVNLDSQIEYDLGADWADRTEIPMAIEEEFEIEISDEEIEKIHFPACTVRELFDYLYLKINDTTEIGKLEAKRLAKLREQVERKVAEANGLDELRKQTEGKLAEAQRLAKLREQAEGKLAEAKRLAELREQAERKAAEQAKCEAELREQAEQKAAEETKHLDELQKQAEQKVAEEAKRLSELQKQAEQKAAEEAKRLDELQKQDEIFLKLRRVLAEELLVDEEEVKLDSDIEYDLGLGSRSTYGLDYGLDHIELAMAIEEEFEIEIPDDVADKIGLKGYSRSACTVRELFNYLYQKINDTTKTE